MLSSKIQKCQIQQEMAKIRWYGEFPLLFLHSPYLKQLKCHIRLPPKEVLQVFVNVKTVSILFAVSLTDLTGLDKLRFRSEGSSDISV